MAQTARWRAVRYTIASLLRYARVIGAQSRRRDASGMQENEAILRSITEGVLACDLRGRLIYANTAAAELIDSGPGGVTGRCTRDVLRLYGADGKRLKTTALDHALRTGETVTSGLEWLHPVGRDDPLPIVEVASPMQDHDGTIRGAVLLLRKAGPNPERGGASRTLRAVVDASPDAIVGVGKARQILCWNPAAQRMFGYDEWDALGSDSAMLIAPRWRQRHPVADSFGGMGGATGPVDLLCVRRDGSRFRVTMHACPVPDGECARDGVVLSVTLRESGEQHRRERRTRRSLRGARDARQQANTSNRIKDELLATVSHELRTPLNVIYGWIEVLRHGGDGELQQQAIDAIDRSARSLSRMVGDILDVSSLATGKLRLDSMPVDLVRIVADVADAFRTTASISSVLLATECTLGTCVVSGDGERLRQMLSNLLSNAFKFTPEGGRVTVGLARKGGRAVLTVADTGQGIAPDFAPHVFEAFRRADGSPASSRRGLGLGLSIVRHIAELHGGTVTVHSAGRNCGSTFTVTLPAGWQPTGALAWAMRQQEQGGEPLALDAHRILVVDDDATTRASLVAALTTLGAQVDVASSGREALAKVAEMQPTVVLSDLAMPDGDGFWLLHALRRRSMRRMRPVRVLAVTAHAGRSDERHALDAGFDGYLCKPVDMQTLACTIVKVAGTGN